MERLYNPDLMPEEEIKATFVARQNIVEELLSLIRHQPDGAGMQHVIIIAPRGMGKTTVLLMLRFAIRDGDLAKRWQVVQFPEERYSIYDLADFWMEVLGHLHAETNDAELRERAESLRKQYRKNDELQEAALALIKDWRKKHKRRLVVLVDNFDMILEQINDERDNARLRDVLMNDGTVMLVGGATTFFHEARAYDQPLYNFFKIYNLDDLNFEQIQGLLRSRAAFDGQADFEEKLKANASRLRALEHFTGGNPRLVLMLYRVITQSDISDVQAGLEKLLDEVTPFYKSKVESLPPQQRKILDYIARVSAQTNEGLTPTEIAEATRMTANQASAQLKRLAEYGYVRAANLRGRSSYYMLSEPLYAIWHQMRFGRDARERMGWLVNILKALYDAEEMGTQSDLLERRFYECLMKGKLKEASDTFTHWVYLLEAMVDSPAHARATELIFKNATRAAEFAEARHDGFRLIKEGKWAEALEQLECALSIQANNPELWIGKALSHLKLKQFEEAITSCNRALEIDSNLQFAWLIHGTALGHLGHYKDAITSFDREPDIRADTPEASDLRTMMYLARFLKRITEGDFKSAKNIWREVQHAAKLTRNEVIHETISTVLLGLALNWHIPLSLIRQLIGDADVAEQLFPLARAIDYVQTGDEALLEKLSPEVRGVVEEIVSKLLQAKNQTENPPKKARAKKSKPSTRRTRKQLR